MRRREFIALLGSTSTWPLAARAQQPNGRTRPMLGYLVTGTDAGYAPLTTPFLSRLREIGYTDGRNIDIVTRYADADYTRLPGLADELVRLRPDVIVAVDPPAAFAAKKATVSLPIVAAVLNDPVRLGMIASYARPGGNVTGILSQVEGLPGKQVEIAQELIPGLTALGMLANPANATHGYQRQEIEAAATSRGIKIVAVEARSKADLEPAFKALHAAGVRAGVLLRDSIFVDQFRSIAELAMTLKVATIASQDTYVEAGGLVGYGVDDSENHRRAADFVDRILKGSKPADLPVEFSTKLVTSINLKAAKALDLTIPPTLLARADKVIE